MDEISSWDKEKKTCKHFIPEWDFTMSMLNYLIFDACAQYAFNMFEHNESLKKDIGLF